MARISRRHVFHAASASVLAAALALPAGLMTAAGNAPSPNENRAGAPARTTAPPPSPSPPPSAPGDPTGPATSASSPPGPAPPSEPSDPSETATSPSSPPSGTPDASEPSEPGGTDDHTDGGTDGGTGGETDGETDGDADGQTTETPAEQQAEIVEATTTLNEEKEQLPEDLASTVETLITVIDSVEDPETSPQDRQGVVESAENLSTALAAISDRGTPPELRKELAAIVTQVTSTLDAVSSSRVPAEQRSMLTLVVKRTTTLLDAICDPRTPQAVRKQMITIMKDTTYVVARSQEEPQAGSAHTSRDSPGSLGSNQAIGNTLVLVSSSSDIMHDRRTPPKEKERLANITQQVSTLLRKISDPRTSQKDRSRATKELDQKTSRMKDQQEESASAQERPKEALGKAAAFCTSAIFESTPESALMRGLKELIPPQWEAEGVKDFWKAQEKSDDMLDVLAQLRNDEHTHGPFEVAPLIIALAELVPHDKLFGSLGGSAAYCEQTAAYLEKDSGITVDTWLGRIGD
ncbi:hypothetical protein ACIRPQ_22670 [Streptomyces sp. NPDC101213]|uniref:hypothetical protein n=1 Tax=Streptomyces sp. NPDC101213 TaxID=3366130 RepID=UPI0037F8C09C